MERGRFIIFSVLSAVCIVTAVLVALLILDLSSDLPEVHLPEATNGTSSDNGSGGSFGNEQNLINPLELRPETLQYILEIIEKPKSYSCHYGIESFWADGSSSFDVNVYQRDGVLSVYILNDMYLKRCLLTEDEYYIWYADERGYYSGTRGTALADESIADCVQMAGSYTELLELDVADILETEYTELDGVYCIYAKAAVGELGYISKYYIYPDTGILLSKEIYSGENLVYRMNSSDVVLSVPYDDYFTLPGGKSVS